MPLIVFYPGRKVAAVLATDEKGYRKSLERGEIWHRDSMAGRLLPYKVDGKEAAIASVKNMGSWIEAVLSVKEAGTDAANHEEREDTSRENIPVVHGYNAENVFSVLEKVVRNRRKQMPEGSYTTHLFSSGGEKIRKKLGEEAIELILAGDKKSIVYEAADLVYHLLVLLENESVPLSDIERELENRMK